MPEVRIRPAIATDLPRLRQIDHSCDSEYLWQMEFRKEEGLVETVFRQVHLPRPVTVPYPRPLSMLAEEWEHRGGFLVAEVNGECVGYLRFNEKTAPQTAWVMDVVVTPPLRRQGIATALLLAAQTWAEERGNRQMVWEISSKCYPAICLARKLGFEFCGYNDHHYGNLDIALFFRKMFR